MTPITQPLRDEHAHLIPHIQALREVADQVGETSVESLRQEIDGAYQFLTHHLIPHAEAEDQVLYPVVGKALDAPQATATMRRDHVEVGRLTAELGALRAQLVGTALDPVQARALRRVLYGLYALVRVHFAKEEEIYLPILDQRLSAEEARGLFAAMDHAAGRHHAQAAGTS
ncbi:MAG TPA: hemerythrin domain-containing protein [Actinomycetes bacterium]|jgi:iron-sulfur cluster repair protein YtfE (RIC family)|nr:hemerythrin domain-containing protein [Actinomycetes bacterium]